MCKENNTSTVTEPFLACWLVEGMDHESDLTMEQFIFVSCVSMSVEMDIKHHPWCC